MSIKAVFGANLRYYRKKRNLSQEELSELVDITPKHLSMIETGSAFVSADLLDRLTKNLGVSAAALFYAVDDAALDDSSLGVIDRIIDRELAKATEAIKVQLRLECAK